MFSERSSIIPELESHFHFSWCILNTNKCWEGKEVQSSKGYLSKTELALEEVGVKSQWKSAPALFTLNVYRSSWSLTKTWEADWRKKEEKSQSVVVNFELNKALWIVSSVQMQVSPRCWFILFFCEENRLWSRQWSFCKAFMCKVWRCLDMGSTFSQSWAADYTAHQSVLSFLPLAQRHFCMWRETSLVGRREQVSWWFSLLFGK